MRSLRYACAFAGSALALAPAAGFASLPFQAVALSGQTPPSLPAGVTYSAFNPPALNRGGKLIFFATLSGAGVDLTNDSVLVGGSAGSLQRIARTGDQAPGTAPGVHYADFASDSAAINDAGAIGFYAILGGTDIVAFQNDTAVFASNAGAATLVARETDPAPGTAGVYSRTLPPWINEPGNVVFETYLRGTAAEPRTQDNPRAIYVGSPAAPQLVASEGQAVPAAGAGVTYTFVLASSFNDAGQVALLGALSGTATIPASEAVVRVGSSTQVIARSGGAAPGTGAGVNYVHFSPPQLNEAGDVLYNAELAGTGVGVPNNEGLFLTTPTGTRLIVRRGDAPPAAAAGVVITDISGHLLDDHDDVAFTVTLAGPGISGASNTLCLADAGGTIRLLARAGDPAFGTPAGVNYLAPSLDAMNDLGQVVFTALLAGTGVTSANNSALYAVDPSAGPILVVRSGDLFDVGGGNLRTISQINVLAGSGDDIPVSLSDDGRLAFALIFTDGSQGVFLTTIPEPATCASLAVSGAMGWRRRRRRAHV